MFGPVLHQFHRYRLSTSDFISLNDFDTIFDRIRESTFYAFAKLSLPHIRCVCCTSRCDGFSLQEFGEDISSWCCISRVARDGWRLFSWNSPRHAWLIPCCQEAWTERMCVMKSYLKLKQVVMLVINHYGLLVVMRIYFFVQMSCYCCVLCNMMCFLNCPWLQYLLVLCEGKRMQHQTPHIYCSHFLW